ncbi:MAG: leucine-rich repeat domain-containing protein [Paludibacteraceae bacterium]|nr:leucine-rich repeat domain-containing protein [Paludibacteraceae bacterium]
MRKFLLLFTALLLSVTAMAYDFKVDGLCYAIVGEGYSVEVTAEADFNNNYPDLVKAVIPNYVEYDNAQYRVLGLGENAFNGAKNLESIEFPSYDGGYEFYIKSFAAANCPKLKNVDLVVVSEIGDAAFAGAALESIRIWWGIEKIGNQIFMGCKNLTEIKVDENNEYYDSRDNCNAIVETKTNTLIMGCNASTIPNTVTTIGRFAFQGCENLTIEHLPTNVINVGSNSFDGTPLCPYTSTPQEGAFYIDHILYRYYTSNPETATTLTVKEGTLGIAEYACAGIKFSSLTLPTSLKCIENGAFTDTQLATLSLPNSLEYIGENAFSNNNIIVITIPENVKTIGAGAFYGNAINQQIYFNAINCDTPKDSENYIRSTVFDREVESFVFGNKVEKISNSLCEGMYNLTQITIPNSVKEIHDNAFEYTYLSSITIPENVSKIGNNVFVGCYDLTTVNWNAKYCTRIPSQNEYGEDEVYPLFMSTYTYDENPDETYLVGAKNIIFGSEVENIPASLVQFNELVTEITIPSSVKSIEKYAFAENYSLNTVNLPASVESIHPTAFYNTPWANAKYDAAPDGPYYIGTTLVEYKGEMPENTVVDVKEGTTTIAEYALSHPNLVRVTLPESLKEIGENAFYGSGVESITIPENVENIGANAFWECSNLKTVTWNAIDCKTKGDIFMYGNYNIESFIFGNKVKSIPDKLCQGFENLTQIELPSSIETIGVQAFAASGLQSLVIPANVSYIGRGAFGFCENLKTLTWNAVNCRTDACAIDEGTFEGYHDISLSIFFYSPISTVTFSNNVERIPAYMLNSQDELKSVTLPQSLEHIGAYAFGGTRLTTISVPSKVSYIGKNAFGISSLKSFDVAEANTTYASKSGILFTKDLTTIVEIPGNIEGEINIPAQTTNLIDFQEDLIDSPVSAINVESGNASFTSKDGVLFNKDMSVLHIYPTYKTSIAYEVPAEVVEIDTMAFMGAYYLEELSMSDNVTKIGALAFVYSPSLESVKLSSSLKMIPHFAFEECVSLKSVTIPEGVEKIGEGAFAECDALTSVIIPSTVTKIASEAFTIETENLRNVYCYATTPPAYWVPYYEEEEEDGWSDGDEGYIFTNFNANLHVPASALEDYKFHPMYQDFKYIMAMGVVTEPTTDVTIKPSDDNALFTWPVVDNAVSYTLEITFEGELFCTLDFNAYGQLTALNFKRSADATPATGFQFTVTGLEGNTEYGYTLEAKDSENKVLDTYTGTFTTGTPTAVEEVSAASIKVSDGTISCDADYHIYNTIGQDVTSLNGSLQSGIYVVTIGEDKVKVMVK